MKKGLACLAYSQKYIIIIKVHEKKEKFFLDEIHNFRYYSVLNLALITNR